MVGLALNVYSEVVFLYWLELVEAKQQEAQVCNDIIILGKTIWLKGNLFCYTNVLICSACLLLSSKTADIFIFPFQTRYGSHFYNHCVPCNNLCNEMAINVSKSFSTLISKGTKQGKTKKMV